jgi:Spy/CpxP family protein refolding chaperone
MKRWIRVAALSTSIAALLSGGIALAHTADAGASHEHRPHRGGLVRAALQLGSLSPEQRASIEGLAQRVRQTAGPVRSADAQVLTTLAGEIEQASIDSQALSPLLQAEQAAALTENAAERDAMAQLHSILTPAQRGELVDRLETRRPHHNDGGAGHEGAHERRGPMGGELAKLALTDDQRAQFLANLRASSPAPAPHARPGEHRQALESFRGDSFDAGALVHVEHRGEWAERMAQAITPVLTPQQRATLAGDLRGRAARESGH